MPASGQVDMSYPATLLNDNKIVLLEPFSGAKKHHAMQCTVCGHQWSATPISKRQAFRKYGVSGCPQCNDAKKEEGYQAKRSDNIQRLKDRGIEILDPTYDGRRHPKDAYTYTKVLVRNTNCGHEFYCSPTNLLQCEVECSVCGPTKRAAPLVAWSKSVSAKWRETATEWQRYKADVSSLTEQSYQQYKRAINPDDLPRGKAGVDGAYHLDHIVPKRFCFDNNIPASVCASHHNLQMVGWRENVGSRQHIKGAIPPIFFQYISAGTKIEEYARQLKMIFPESQTFVNINDVVVTCFDQESNRAIVVTPIDAQHANQKSALQAQRALSKVGVQYTLLFEDEMANHSLLRAKLLHYANTNTVKRVHARKCEIRQCSKQEKKVLLDNNHVQGNDNAMISYGAYYDDALVAVMTFTKPRVALGQKGSSKEGMWELSRFCTDVQYRIPGIASKLLKHFQRNHQWDEIYSYADKRWSVGNMYHQLGFEQVADNPPDYFYVIGGIRKHRWNYRKDILKNKLSDYDPTQTEYQNMVNHGYWRVWDCGTLKFSVKRAK